MERKIAPLVKKLAVIGAGLAGLACARAAQNAGVDVRVFEKSRGLGGRLATRRPFGASDAMALDHGAPFAEPSAQYADTASRLPTLGAPWSGRWPENWGAQPAGEVLGAHGMSDLAGALARGSGEEQAPIPVALEAEVVQLEEADAQWLLRDAAGGAHGPFDAVVVAAPAPQTRELLGAACPAVETDAEFHPVWAILTVFDPAPPHAAHAAMLDEPEPPLTRVFRQSAKPNRDFGGREAWVGHASYEWSHFHLEQQKNAVAAALLPALIASLSLDMATAPKPTYLAAHRWRYGVVRKPIGEPYWINEPKSGGPGLLGCCGDWRLGPKAGDALASGERMGAAIAAKLLC